MDTRTDPPPRRRGPKLPELALTDDERTTLQRWARRRSSSQALAERCRIVLACAEGASNIQVAQRLGVSRPTVTKWRSRFVARRLEGLADEPRPGAARKLTDEQVERVIVTTLETRPADATHCATHWSTRSLARALGMNQTAVSRIWRAFGLKPHLTEAFKLSTDPQFIDKVRDVVGLYLNPPEAALVLCVDEKTQVQALDRTAPVLPLLPGVPERRTHDYTRHGTTNLYAALDVASGKVISQMTARHRATEFKRFLAQLDRSVPAELAVHVIVDNSSTHKTPAIQRWLLAHPRFQLHFTPTYSSWLNLVERWFAELTTKWLRRGTHRSVPRHPPLSGRAGALDPALDRHLERAPATVRVDQDRRRDPGHHRYLLPAHQRLGTLDDCFRIRARVTSETRAPRVGVAEAPSTSGEASCTPTSTPSSLHCTSASMS